MVNTSLDGRFLARSACEKEHRCKISHLRSMEPSKCRLPMAQPFMCCTVEQGWDKHITGIDFPCFFVCFVALRPKSTAMVIAERSVHLITLFPGQA